jgi:hypothetical protein
MRNMGAVILMCLGMLFGPAFSPWTGAQQVPIDPASTHIFPAGGQRGTVVQARVGGQCLPPDCGFHVMGEGVKAAPVLGSRAAGRYESSPRRDPRETPMACPKEWQATVEITADAPLGQKLWRLSSARGGTGARAFVVGELPEIVESESNSSPQKAERVSLPLTINGQIAGERDIDYFQFSAEQGETITAEVVAARLGSPLETVIEFHDANGRRVQAQELRAGSDPVLVLNVPVSGEYRLFVANLSFRGGPEFVYRITLAKLPYIQFAFPPTVSAGPSREIEVFRIFGADTLRKQAEALLAPPKPGQYWLKASAAAANPIVMEVTDLASVVEHEPNDAAGQSMELAPDVVVSGQLASPSDEDWFRFAARKDQRFSIDCQPCPKSSPALPVVSLLDAGGSTLASAKSAEAIDRAGQLDWRAPADGTYYLRVADTRQGASGGPEFVYTVSLTQGRPDFSLSAKSDFINVAQDGRSEFEVTVTRRGGFDQPIELSMDGRPEGVRFEPKQIPANQNSTKIAVIAAAEARATSATVQLTGTASIDGVGRSHALLASHLGHDADGIGVGPPSVDNLQVTVAHKPVFKLYCSEAYQYAHRGTVYPYLMEIERLDGFKGPIHLEVADRQIKDLDGIEVREMTVEPGQTSFLLPLYLPETMHINIQAHSNVYAQGYVTFMDKWGQQQTHLVVSTMRCMVRTLPPVAKLQSVDRALTVKKGSIATCRLVLIRTSNFSGPMKIELVAPGEADGYFAEPFVLPANESTASVAVRIGPEVKPRADATLTFRATGSMTGSVQVISEVSVAIEFE